MVIERVEVKLLRVFCSLCVTPVTKVVHFSNYDFAF